MKVRLTFTVSKTALPALITVRDFDGRLILYKRIYCARNLLCFCSKSRNLIITVRPYNADFYEKSFFIKFGRRACYNIRLDFNFNVSEVAAPQNFYLFDGNYLFPVQSARLYFSGGG